MKSVTGLAVALVCSTVLASEPVQRTLTFEDRVAAQRAIERVYWSHRIWPKENSNPKPPLKVVMSDALIRAKVEDYLRKSNALGTWWQRPITGEQLQAELDRMVKNSRDPQVLQELFSALGNDPYLIAETLGRQTLADRLIRNWYANDTRIHAAARAKAEAAIAGCSSADCMPSMGATYRETTLRLRDQTPLGGPRRDGGHVLLLGSSEWKAALAGLAESFGVAPDSIPLRKLTGVRETPDAFVVSSVLSRAQDEIVTAAVIWPKERFDAWWASQSASLTVDVSDTFWRFRLAAIASSGCPDDTWSRTRQDSPDARSDHTAVWTGAEMIVWGGHDGESSLDSGARYDPSTDTWAATSMGSNLPEARRLHTAVWTGTAMVVWGGESVNGLLNSGGRYDPTNDSWKSTSQGENLPSGRFVHTAVWTGSEMIVWGGIVGYGNFANSGGRYNPATDRWIATSEGDNVPDGRASHTAVWTGTAMIVWGGIEGDPNSPSGEHYLSSGGRYDPSADSWLPTSTGGFTPSGRRDHAAVWTGREMIIWGGYAFEDMYPTFPNIGGRYDPSTDTWTPTSAGTNVPAGRETPTAVWTGTEMLIWGGANYYLLNSGALYKPSTNTWRPTSSVNAPKARTLQSGVWTGSEMIVWGGWVDIYVNGNTGGRYNPTSDSWVPTASAGTQPASRYAHTAVWTGSELIIWGGASYDGGDSFFNSGGRYNAATDDWKATSIGAGVPTARSYHTAVWTGTDMIVWGGSDDSSWFNSGGRYSPYSDVWTPTSTGADVPSARDSHTAIWTGSKMIVWGGRSTTATNTGARYDPTTDGWLPTSTDSGVPEPRYAHSAVWTGREMIVWGGGPSGFYNPRNSGGRYDPAEDTWLPTSRGVNVPAGRSNHTAVWTGTEMIVWGGSLFGDYSGYDYFNTGGRFNPLTGLWTVTSVGVNVPDARENHTATWTGKELIVWGGNDFFGAFNSGGRYDPSQDTWTPTLADRSAPTRRLAHSAVWTGAEMIVWGGWPLTSSGGRYCAHNRCFDDDGPLSCDDGNPCTDDVCDPAAGCVHTDNSGPCDDGNPCTASDTCTEGLCVGHSGCEDGLPCTDDIANPADNCACSNPVSSQGTACVDGNRCTLGTICDGLGGGLGDCGGGIALNCDDGNPCTDDSCDPALGCVHTDNAAGCDDGIACTTSDTCGAGRCRGGARLDCDDGNICTDDSCDDATGCVHAYNFNPCDDGTVCTTGDTCWLGACYAGALLNCNDNNPCTDDSCDPATGCMHVNNTRACDDGNACTVDDTCAGGLCLSGAPRNCDDNNPCTIDLCDSVAGCFSAYTTNPCNDGTACTFDDTCHNGACVGTPRDCNDQDPCTTDSCDPEAGCVHTNNFLPCDDGNVCTSNDTCNSGTCRGVPSDGNACTDACTQNGACQGGLCVGGTPRLCNDDNPCTDDGCNPATGCVFINNTTPCDDGNACTTGDTCGASADSSFLSENFDGVTAPSLPAGWTSWAVGAGTPWKTRSSGSDSPPNSAFGVDSSRVADEGLVSPAFAVTSATARLTFRNRWRFEDDSLCWDAGVLEIQIGVRPYADILDAGGSFVSGGYTGYVMSYSGNPLRNRAAWCNTSPGYPGYVTSVVNLPAAAAGQTIQLRWRVGSDGAIAFLGQDIDSIDVSDPVNTCNPGAARDCDDGNPCTYDSCDPATGCVHTYSASACDDNNPCTTDTCDPASGCVHTNNAEACDDRNACTSGDTCGGGYCQGTPIVCNDDNPCTDDSCNPATGCVFANNTNPCNDGNPCTTVDRCGDGLCHGTGNACDDNNPCTDDSCNPATAACTYSANDANSCSDGNACTQTDTCQSGVCIGSNPVDCDGPCPPGFTVVDGGCLRTYEIDMSLLDNLDQSCDGTGVNRFNCSGSPYGFHWTDQGVGVGPVMRVDVQFESGLNCDGVSSSVRLNGVGIGSFTPIGDCTCEPPHGTISFLGVALQAYVRPGLNVVSIVPNGTCEGLTSATSLGGNYARVSVTYQGRAGPCTTGLCDASTGACGFVARDCDDRNPCTDDSCEVSTGCVHSPNSVACDDGNSCTSGDTCSGGSCHGTAITCDDHNPCTTDTCNPSTGCVFTNNAAPCDDGNACTTGDTCVAGSCEGTPLRCDDGDACNGIETCDPARGCVAGTPIVCSPADQCHTAGVCLPGSGVCSYGNLPSGTVCDDGNSGTDRDRCQNGVCTGVSCSSTNDPKSKGWYKGLCHNSHSGDSLTDGDATCVGELSSTFAGITTVAQVCGVLEPSQPNNDPCGKDQAELMTLLLNICKQRVCPVQGLDSECGTNRTVARSLAESDAIFRDPSRTAAQCEHAKCVDEEINNGHALELDTLSTRRELGKVRLNWAAPILDDGTGTPSGYKIWRRPIGSRAPFALLGTTSATTYLDTSATAGSWQYDVTAIN